MDNWEELHECQDEQDAKRLHKQAQLMKTSSELTNTLSSTMRDYEIDDNLEFVQLTGKHVHGRQKEDLNLLLLR